MSRPTPRRPSTSRASTPRPRKLAGGTPPTDPQQPADEPETEPDVPDEPPPPPDEWPVEGPEDDDDGSILNSPRVTRMLLITSAVIALILIVEAAWYVVREITDDDKPKASHVAEGSIDVSSDRPVEPNKVGVQAGVDAAAKAAEKIINRTYKNYDKEVDAATALMTPDFAEEYRKTTDDVRGAFVARKTTVQIRVVGQGVVRASDTELQALLFVNQFVFRGGGKDTKASATPYRALLTMVNTDKGWLVEDLQTE
jgi:Mce-associated membrane protein